MGKRTPSEPAVKSLKEYSTSSLQYPCSVGLGEIFWISAIGDMFLALLLESKHGEEAAQVVVAFLTVPLSQGMCSNIGDAINSKRDPCWLWH